MQILSSLLIKLGEMLKSSRMELVYDEQACDCKCLLIFELPSSSNVGKNILNLQITFYALTLQVSVRIFSTY